MPTKKHSFWQGRVISLKENNPTWGAGRITAALSKEEPQQDEPVGDSPSERWVGGILRNVWAHMEEKQLREYRILFWPESFQRNDLPWEASGAALELLMLLDQNGVRERPPIRLVRWYWRVTQTSKDVSRALSLDIARQLADQEERGQTAGNRGAEWLLAYYHVTQTEGQDNLDEERNRLYRDATERPDSPIPRYEPDRLKINTTKGTDRFQLELALASVGLTRA